MPCLSGPTRPLVATFVAVVVILAGCSSSDTTTTTDTTESVQSSDTTSEADDTGSTAGVGDLFSQGALIGNVETVDCTLENGTDTSCYQFLVDSQPDTVDPGPFCPTSVDSDEFGIFTWDGDEPGLYALDAAFWEMLAGQGYTFVSDDGTVNVQDPGAGGPGGAGSTSGDASGDSCLEAVPDDSYTLQILVPVDPELLDTPIDLGTVSQVGLAIDGVTIFGDAPSGTSGAIPALDPCGGHNDPSGYYHWHFGSDSIQTNLDDADIDLTCNEAQDAEALVGLALDGYPIYGPEDDGEVPTDLDACSGHTGETADFAGTYHYHLTYESPNLPSCRVGATADDKITSPDNDAISLPDGGGAPGGGGPGAPSIATATPVAAPTQGTTSGHCHEGEVAGEDLCH